MALLRTAAESPENSIGERMRKQGRYEVVSDDYNIQSGKGEACCLRPYQRFLLVFAICLLALIVIGLAVALVYSLTSSSSSPKGGGNIPAPPTTKCPSDPPTQAIPCNPSSKDDCINAGCCWYTENSTCLLVPICSSEPTLRFSCLPEEEADWNRNETESLCLSRGCCWQPNATVRCSYPSNYGYKLEGSLEDTPLGSKATVVRKSAFPTTFGSDSQRLGIDITYETPHRMRVKVLTYNAWPNTQRRFPFIH